MKIKKLLSLILATILLVAVFAGCSRITKIESVGEIDGKQFDQNDVIFRYYFHDSIFQILSSVGIEPGTEAAKNYINETKMEDGKLAIDTCREEAPDP